MKSIKEILLKIQFYIFRPKAVFVFGKNNKLAVEMIQKTLGSYFKFWNKVFVFELDSGDFQIYKFLINNSAMPMLVLTDLKKENIREIKKVVKIFIGKGKVILNNDNELATGLKEEIDFQGLTFGFKSSADFQASDIKENGEINFKLNYEGSSVPVWIKGKLGRESVGAALAAFATGLAAGLNLVEISQSLKSKN